MEEDRIVTNKKQEEDTFEGTIRPDSIDEYIGQTDLKENMNIFIIMILLWLYIQLL